MLMYWVILFFLLALISRLLLRLPPALWRVLFALPYLGALNESLKPFVQQSWPFPRDGLSDFFASIVAGIGLCVCIYAGAYFKSYEKKRFFPLFFAFTGSMLGVLWADNIFMFYGFWEATGFCSFLLIGFKFTDFDVRKGATQALIVNVAGGLCLLLALLIMAQVSGSHSLVEILYDKRKLMQDNNLLMLMILLAAMIKSAQFPFHFWLPGAMVAPTPASAFLHSATMVKLGVFLLARFSPVFDENMDWVFILSLVGAVTLIWGMIVSLTKNDLKQLFAWTTVSSLGGMCILVGLHVSYSWTAFFSYVLAHSFYKASLFLCVGNIDKQMGGRSMEHISGLIRRMPVTSLAMLMALGSMMGLPFSMGFLGKEYLLKSALQLEGSGSLLVVALVGASILSIVVGYRLIRLVFRRPTDSRRLKEAPASMWAPPLVLASAGWVSGFFLDDINKYFLSPVVSSILLQPVDMNLEMWTGVNLALVLSVVSLLSGIFLALRYAGTMTKVAMGLKKFVKPSPRVGIVGSLSKKLMDRLQNGRLSYYILWLLIPCFLGLSLLVPPPAQIFAFESHGLSYLQTVPFLIVLMGLMPMLLSAQPLMQIIGLGVLGFGVSLFYLSAGATDLAMTQMAVEALSVLVLTLSLIFLRTNPSGFSWFYKIVRTVVTASAFLGTLLLCALLREGKNPSRVAEFFTENAFPLGKGLNVVNVILVDFRALDTFGEITVLGIVAAGIHFLFLRKQKLNMTFKNSAILTTSMKVFAPLFGLISLIVLFRGHNAPGGGFIGGLLLAISYAFSALVMGESWMRRRLLLKPMTWMVWGLSFALSAAVLPTLQNQALFKAQWLEGLSWLGTPLLFDLGIYLLVLGMGTSLFLSFFRRDV